MLHYIIQVTVFQSVFLVVYDLLLRRQTFFNWNRGYLLITSVLSLLLPFMELSVLSQYTADYGVIQLPEIVLGDPIDISKMSQSAMETAGITVQEAETPVWRIVLLVGSTLFGMWFLFKCIKLFILRSNNPRRWADEVLVVSLKDSLQAFSFFNTIFMGNKIDEKERDIILEHELVHVKQRHSLDIVWYEILRIVFWFNPCVYWYQDRMTELHEFIADRQVLSSGRRSDFYKNLLQQVLQTKTVSLPNTFFSKSLVKKRLKMINKSGSKHSSLWRYALALPLAVCMLVYVSCEKEAIQDELSMELDLEQYSYTLDFNASGEAPSDIQLTHQKFEAFLRSNPDYVGWGFIDRNARTIAYSVHHKDEVPEFESHEMEASFPDGTGYKLLMNISPFMDESLEGTKKDYDGEPEVPFAVIDQVPAFESCSHLSGEERKKCTSLEVAKFVNKNFNTEIASEFGFEGKQRIAVMFKIDEDGNVIDARARGPHEALEDEAVRVINALPQFIPGEHNGERVVVPYSLPILFEIK